MSGPLKFNEDTSKTFKDRTAKNLESAIQCTSLTLSNRPDKLIPSLMKSGKPMLATHSDGSIIKNQDQAVFKQKLVNKVKSWSSKDGGGLQTNKSPDLTKLNPNLENIALNLESLNLVTNASEENLYYNLDIFRARDSLESLVGPRSSKTVGGDAAANSRSVSFPSSSKETRLGPYSDPSLAGDTTTDSTSTVMAWDPWNKLGRKNKKENKRRKQEKCLNQLRKDGSAYSALSKNIDSTGGDEPRYTLADSANVETPNLASNGEVFQESYKYEPYQKNQKSVDFVNDVVVVYFTGDEVISKATEPLKKELDQQNRNKEMRRGHVPCTMISRKQCSGEDYMAAWFKK